MRIYLKGRILKGDMNAIDIDSGRKKNYSDQRDNNNDLVCVRPNICPPLSF